MRRMVNKNTSNSHSGGIESNTGFSRSMSGSFEIRSHSSAFASESGTGGQVSPVVSKSGLPAYLIHISNLYLDSQTYYSYIPYKIRGS